MHGDARSTLVMLGVDAGTPDVPLLRPGVVSKCSAAQAQNMAAKMLVRMASLHEAA